MSLPTPVRVLAVVAHPDDESWLMGGTLAAWSAAGADMHVVCMTTGDAGADRRGGAQGPKALAALRREEFARACCALGVAGDVLNYPDGGLTSVPREEALNELSAYAALYAPDRVLTHGLDGDYGHLDHLAVAGWVRAVWPDAWTAALPPGRMHRVWRALRNSGFDGVEKGMHAHHFGAHGDVAVPLTAAAWSAKREAVACHESQLRDRAVSSFLSAGLMDEDWTKTERWSTGQ
ncbi:MAG: PIG-L family deacetylase [Deltaproteobacteria bacterium]|nr:PIG-L family deacetylase [Deltaproteobacteria bacterium]